MNEKNFSTSQTSSDQQVVTFYDQYANFWDARFGNKGIKSISHFIERRLNSLLEILGPTERLSNKSAVELGVGTGVYIDTMSKIFKDITAIDGSKNMIEILTQKLTKMKISNVTPVLASVNDLAVIPTASTDFVYFVGLIEHVIERDIFVKEIDRILKPGGYVLGVTPNRISPWYKIRALIRRTGKHCSSDHFYSKNEIKILFEKQGFIWEQHIYWGLIYAGLSYFPYFILSFLEKIIEKSPLAFLLGGITFKVSKPLEHKSLAHNIPL